ncbi:MAG TPA: type IX secretion system membrane protein PorP/SprF [Ferruginibacter sp.]|nr:type IX secretion system membrane protein PorP/SprF [Ferruginibacter sp.]HMP22382.1 type IX secretion system membrane protein PorP/SprF [Ferruginibacter sp.]
MKKMVLIGLFLYACAAQAQQKPYYTQYILNNYMLNPALSGIETYTDVKLSYRSQWTGIDGSPVTAYASINAPIGDQDKVSGSVAAVERTGANLRGKSYWNEYSAPEAHSGAGLILLNDKTGFINRFSMYGTYAYHKPLGNQTTLSAGFLAGFTNVTLDASKVILDDPGQNPDPFDPSIGFASGDLKALMPEVGAGLWLYSRDYYLGLSVLNIVPAKARFVTDSKYGSSFVPHYIFSAGYRFMAADDLSVLPSVIVQSVQPLPMQVHANVKLQFQDQLWFGGSYRYGDKLGGFAAMAGVYISSAINIGYSYDMSANSRLRQFAGDTHEIVVGFLLNNRNGDSCPRNVW